MCANILWCIRNHDQLLVACSPRSRCQRSYVNNQRENYEFHFNGIIGMEAKQDEVCAGRGRAGRGRAEGVATRHCGRLPRRKDRGGGRGWLTAGMFHPRAAGV